MHGQVLNVFWGFFFTSAMLITNSVSAMGSKAPCGLTFAKQMS